MPRRPPFLSSTALVATVVPWATWVMAVGSTPTDSTRRLTAAMAASPGSAGVLAILNTIAGCPSRMQTTSVKVPPMSIPIRHGAQESLMALLDLDARGEGSVRRMMHRWRSVRSRRERKDRGS